MLGIRFNAMDRISRIGVIEKPFTSFGFAHAVSAIIALCLAFGLPLLIAKTASARQQDRFRLILTGIVLAQLLLNPWMRVAVYGEPLHLNLPLHLCHASLMLGAITLLFRSYLAYEVAYFWALGGAIPAILMPDVAFSFPHPLFLLFFIGHGLELACVAFATFVFGFRPRLISVGKAIAATAAFAALIVPINYALDANYLYLRHKPAQPSIIDLLGPWPWYVLALAGLVVMLAFLCYLPFALQKHLSSNKTH